eukprot:8709143-Alexandrium_andersonii.AAC.1
MAWRPIAQWRQSKTAPGGRTAPASAKKPSLRHLLEAKPQPIAPGGLRFLDLGEGNGGIAALAFARGRVPGQPL